MDNDLLNYTKKKSKAYQKANKDSKNFYAKADKNLKSLFSNFFQSINQEDKEKFDVKSKIKLLKENTFKSHDNTTNFNFNQQQTRKQKGRFNNTIIGATKHIERALEKSKKRKSFNLNNVQSLNTSGSGVHNNLMEMMNIPINDTYLTLDDNQVGSISTLQLKKKSNAIDNDTISNNGVSPIDSQSGMFKDLDQHTTETLMKEEKNLQEMLTKSLNLNKNNPALMTILPVNILPVEAEKELENVVKQTNDTIISYNSLCQDLKNSLIYCNNKQRKSFLLNSNRSSQNGTNMNDVSFTKSTQYLKQTNENILSPKHENVRTIIDNEIGIESENSIISDKTIKDEHDIILNEQKKVSEPITMKEYKYRKYRKTNLSVYDSLSDCENIDDEGLLYINPNSNIKIILDFFVLITTMFFMCFTPIELGFLLGLQYNMLIISLINILGEILFIIDLVCGFYTAFYDTVDHLQKLPDTIIRNYLKTWFVLDFITSFPISSMLNSYLYFVSPSSYFYIDTFSALTFSKIKYIHCLKLLKLLKILKVSFCNIITTFLYDKAVHSPIGRSLLLYITMFIFLISLHIMACIFVFIGYNNYPSWITALQFKINQYTTIYFASIYYIMLTIVGVGYGDIISTNYSERGFSIFLLAIGILIYSWFVSTFSKYREESFVSGSKAEECLKKLDYLETLNETYKNIPVTLYNSIYRYLMFNFQKEKFSLDIIFSCLPTTLQRDLLFAMYRPIVKRFVFFKYFDNEDFIMKILSCLKRSMFLRNERLIHKGDFVEEMLFVQKGKLALELPLPNDLSNEILRSQKINKIAISFDRGETGNTYYKEKHSRRRKKRNYDGQQYIKLIEIRTNEHYGDLSIFLNQRSILSVRVSSKTAQLFYLKKADAFSISSQFPEIWRIIIINSIFNMKQINKLINKTILFFYESNKKILDVLLNQNNKYNEEMNNKETELLKQAIITNQKIEIEERNEDDEKEINYYGEEHRQLNIISEASAAGLLSSDNEQVMLEEERKKSSNLVQRTRISGKTLPKTSVKLNFNFKRSNISENHNNELTGNGSCNDTSNVNNSAINGSNIEDTKRTNVLSLSKEESSNIKEECSKLTESSHINASSNRETPYLQCKPKMSKLSHFTGLPFDNNVNSTFNEISTNRDDNNKNGGTCNDFFFIKTTTPLKNSDSLEINTELEKGESLQAKPTQSQSQFMFNTIQPQNRKLKTHIPIIIDSFFAKKTPSQQTQEKANINNEDQNDFFFFKKHDTSSKPNSIRVGSQSQQPKPNYSLSPQYTPSMLTNSKRQSALTCDELYVNKTPNFTKDTKRTFKPDFDFFSAARSTRSNAKKFGLSPRFEKKTPVKKNEVQVQMNQTGIAEFDTSLKLVIPNKFHTSKGLFAIKEKKKETNHPKDRVTLIANNIEQNIQNLSNPEKFYESQFLDMISTEGKLKNKQKQKKNETNHLTYNVKP